MVIITRVLLQREAGWQRTQGSFEASCYCTPKSMQSIRLEGSRCESLHVQKRDPYVLYTGKITMSMEFYGFALNTPWAGLMMQLFRI